MLEQRSYDHSFIVAHEFALACNNAVRHNLYNIVAHFKRDRELVQSPFQSRYPLAFATSVRWDSAV